MLDDAEALPDETGSDSDERPFSVIARFPRAPQPAPSQSSTPEPTVDAEIADADSPADEAIEADEESEVESEVSAEDIQEAYLKALMVMDEIESLGAPSAEESPTVSTDVVANTAAPATSPEPDLTPTGFVESADAGPLNDAPDREPIELEDLTAPISAPENSQASRPAVPKKENQQSDEEQSPPAVNPARVIEAILFVGGNPITCKRLCNVLGGNIDQAFVEQRIDELNTEYASQGRPYEIRLGEGGYRLALKQEFESVRNKVYGAGPREVRLTQDALEILALVAYQQPLSHADLEASGKRNAGNLVRQLIRRELVGITRIDSTRSGIRYQTTPRFLSLFGLASIDELPKADELSIR